MGTPSEMNMDLQEQLQQRLDRVCANLKEMAKKVKNESELYKQTTEGEKEIKAVSKREDDLSEYLEYVEKHGMGKSDKRNKRNFKNKKSCGKTKRLRQDFLKVASGILKQREATAAPVMSKWREATPAPVNEPNGVYLREDPETKKTDDCDDDFWTDPFWITPPCLKQPLADLGGGVGL